MHRNIYSHAFKKGENVVYLFQSRLQLKNMASRWQKLPLLGFFFPQSLHRMHQKEKGFSTIGGFINIQPYPSLAVVWDHPALSHIEFAFCLPYCKL